MFRVLGVVLIAVAIAVAVVPHYTDCQSQGKMITLANGKTTSMKCHWTGVAELGTAIPLLGVGGMMLASRRKETLMYLSIVGVLLSGVVLALPDRLIGVCQTPTMTCVTAMKPALNGLGSLAVALSLVGLVWSRRAKGLA